MVDNVKTEEVQSMAEFNRNRILTPAVAQQICTKNKYSTLDIDKDDEIDSEYHQNKYVRGKVENSPLCPQPTVNRIVIKQRYYVSLKADKNEKTRVMAFQRQHSAKSLNVCCVYRHICRNFGDQKIHDGD
ncbi:hypothetical protein DPMN_082011 [Dreissena polymorpha]|uniref:Uncharacterized protein n=1 Tax=Dreissena polymorpha TaxID=45954 RepID=A0A9D3Y7D0_DREPO|nr:hypothetical protein DPMN_082011 [Dreissena polymorpha]